MEAYKFQLSFKGQLIENSVDAFDVANTILATSQALQEIISIQVGEEAAKRAKLNISAFKQGSLINDFMLFLDHAHEIAAALLPIIGDINKFGNEILTSLKTYIEIKKLLKGKPPESIKAVEGQKIEIKIKNYGTMNITYNDLKLLQSKTLAKNIEKATQPLRKEDSPIESIDIKTEDSVSFDVKKSDAAYLESQEGFQTLPSFRLKGVITKIDSKVRSGYINAGTKRIPFTYPSDLVNDKFIILVESLKRKIQIFLIGEVTMDYESNPRTITVSDVESEIKLF